MSNGSHGQSGRQVRCSDVVLVVAGPLTQSA